MAQIPIQNFHPHEPVFVKSNQISQPPVLEVDSVEDPDNPNKFDNILIQNVITWTEKKKYIIKKNENEILFKFFLPSTTILLAPKQKL